ncbi:hypothetical protein ASPVEDRAFT_66499 [Aspergillus versicolor CBS 583.65]|uniref:Uncharacterized protein n=1 Tax=Aspergillus versicolor CBS 583.65 TaxID=1036611 RepID=A0A1L9Q4I4_ASPVE|nr:uncharacterized protein ASPVEDRAFT_66499 [Aspergillus versicolor CBS 583.65]OJJ08588.1 hypothetical protein ASPVEDRAFT_66499 [Aspergillus versicolor CBS 583.65]
MPPKLRSKRPGRPRLDTANDASLTHDRRDQLRRAQKAYRLKKEAIFQNATSRAEKLEASMREASDEVIGLDNAAAEAQLHLSHPDIYARLQRLRGILTSDSNSMPSESPKEPAAHQIPSPDQIPNLEYPIPMAMPAREYTYSFQETRFSRRLQRYCLEHAYRLFTGSEPGSERDIYRVFRLVPCIRDREKTQPRFLELLNGGLHDPLEVSGLPFYTIGGAGMHYPDIDGLGRVVYPGNRRVPGRILGILPTADQSRGSKELLEVCGFGGVWFDSRDVEGYLKQNGVDVQGGLFPVVNTRGRTGYVLDVEGFFSNQIAVKPVEDHFVSVLPPTRMGDLADWAYGGNILAVAVSAAYATTTPGHHLYSICGHFVRPASPSSNLICRVERIRDTRTFQTRHLRLYQGEHLCLIATADFHIEESAELVRYSAHPHKPTSVGESNSKTETSEPGLYRNIDPFMDVRSLPTSSKSNHNIPDIVSTEQFRINGALPTEADQVAALAFYMDRGLAYIPANHAGRSLFDASACATLDFALRVATHRFDLGEWHTSEKRTCRAGNARALSEGGVFGGGRLLASMTQETILRPKREGPRI